MHLIGFIEEDLVNYKTPSMLLMMPKCDWKCGRSLCHNHSLAKGSGVAVAAPYLVKRYLLNDITKSVVFSGLEPFDSFEDVIEFINLFRQQSPDMIVIYTGYDEEEISSEIESLQEYPNIIVKFGRYILGDYPHFDDILGVNLASDNQYAEKIS